MASLKSSTVAPRPPLRGLTLHEGYRHETASLDGLWCCRSWLACYCTHLIDSTSESRASASFPPYSRGEALIVQ